MKKNVCPLCGKPLKKGSTACSCGYKESLAEQGLLRRLAVWSRVQTLGTVLLVLGFLVGAVVWWRSGDIRWGLLALFAFLFSGPGVSSGARAASESWSGSRWATISAWKRRTPLARP